MSEHVDSHNFIADKGKIKYTYKCGETTTTLLHVIFSVIMMKSGSCCTTT